MKGYTFFVLIAGCLLFMRPSCASGQGDFKDETDTVFIGPKDYCGCPGMYIENNRNAASYDILNRYSFNDHVDYVNSMDTADKFYKDFICKRMKQFDMQGLPANWFGMEFYKGSLYTYISGSDEMQRLQVNDSAYKWFYMDDPGPVRLVAVNKISATWYSMKIAGCYAIDTSSSIVNIYIINQDNKVAIFEFLNYDPSKIYYLIMIAADKIRSYPAIVNYCKYCKAHSFRKYRDKNIPYKEMIERVKSGQQVKY